MKACKNLDVKLLAGRHVGELRRVVIDVRDQDVHSGGGVKSRVTLIRHHHLQSMLTLLLTVQRHPVYDFTCGRVCGRKTETAKESGRERNRHTTINGR